MKKKADAGMLWQMFRSNFMLSACTFGGGFVIVSLMKKQFVEKLGWLAEEEMLDVTAIAQAAPGPILVNASVMLGYRMAGIIGSLVAVLGIILPPMIIISVIAVFYDQFRSNVIIATALQVMRVGVAAVIFDVVIDLGKNVWSTRRALYIGLMCGAFFCAVVLHISAMLIILVCLFVGLGDLVVGLVREKRRGGGTKC